MCDYSLELVASRPAKVGDKLVSTSFPHTITRGFVSVDDPNVAVCVLPGTELAFDEDVACETALRLSLQTPGRAQAGSVSADRQRAGERQSRRPRISGWRSRAADAVMRRTARHRAAIAGHLA